MEYNDKLKLAKEALESGYDKDTIEYIFPELKESEDEKIRQFIKECIEELRNSCPENADFNGRCSDAIAWLEKQGQVKESDISQHENKTCKEKDDSLTQGEQQVVVSYIPKGFHAEIDEDKVVIKQGELKPFEWNEEDEAGLGDALWAIQQARTIAKDENDMGNLWYAESWLKSLRPQNWKPSEEQIEALESATENCAYSEYQDSLRELIKQLKKL